MRRPAWSRSVGVAALLVACLAAPAHAASVSGPSDKAHAALAKGLTIIRRLLHMKQQVAVVSHTVSIGRREASLELELEGGRTRTIALRGGRLWVDGDTVGRYGPGGALERDWRRLLADVASREATSAVAALRDWRIAAPARNDAAAFQRLSAMLRDLAVPVPRAAERAPAAAAADSVRAAVEGRGGVSIRLEDLEALDRLGHMLENIEGVGPELAAALRGTAMQVGDVAVPAGGRVTGDLVVYKGDADIRGAVDGFIVTLFGDVVVHEGASVARDVVAIGGEAHAAPGTVRGELRTIDEGALEEHVVSERAAEARESSPLDRVFQDVRIVLALFVALAMLGFGAVFFGRRYVETIADTVTHSFGRSLVVGVLGQLLLLPTLAMLIVGLVFTLVGILLLPFAVIAFGVATVLALIAGYLAVAHAVGERFARRRMAQGAFVRAPNAYGYVFNGLIGLLGLWALAALTAWMGPIAVLFQVAAGMVTWVAVTAGFGAVLLSRAGLRESFAGRHYGETSDEYLWTTPPATPAAGRTRPPS